MMPILNLRKLIFRGLRFSHSTLRQQKAYNSTNPQPPYNPVNQIENLLREAAKSPAMRPEFYRALFSSELLCLGKPEQVVGGGASAPASIEVREYNGKGVICAFTSKDAAQWYADVAAEPEVGYITIRGSVLFEMVVGKVGLLLNPGHDYGKYFTVVEIEELLKLRLDDWHEKDTIKLSTGQEVVLAQPKDLPLALISALQQYVKLGGSKVKDVHFGLIIGASRPGSMEFVGAVEFIPGASVAEEDASLKDIAMLSKDSLEVGKFFNVCKLRESGFDSAVSSGSLRAVSSMPTIPVM